MQIIQDSVAQAIAKLKLPAALFSVEHPKEESHGDYSTNVALSLAKQVGQKPRELAEKIKELLENDIEVNRLIARMEVAGAGFINFYLKESWLVERLAEATKPEYGKNQNLKNKKTMVEYTDPNPFKEFHIGHLMSNTIGESIARLTAGAGAEVKRVCYQGDVGLHVAKSVWGMEKKMAEEGLSLAALKKKPLSERQQFMGQAYAYGATQYEENEAAKAEMHKLNEQIYKRTSKEINALYDAGREWSLEYFETIYVRLGTKFDDYYFESEAGKVGLEIVEEALAKKVLEVGEEGAVIYKGEKDGMHTRVFRNKLGLPTYEVKDLALPKMKYGRYPYDKSIIVTANEIAEYFRVVLRVMEQLYPDLRAKTIHLPHGMMKLSTGKMSSRTGKVVTGEGLLDELKEVVLKKMAGREIENKDRVADMVAVGALKYTVLKQQIGGDIVYDPEKMTKMDGDTGPYLQYTYARAQSVISKSANKQIGKSASQLNPEELSILRWLYRYPEVVEQAGREYAPHVVAGYLYELASRFNSFYNKHKIVGGSAEGLRLEITRAVGNVVKNGLELLGIAAPEEM